MNLLESQWRAVPDFYARELAGVARAYFRAALLWLVLGALVGLSYSFQFVEGLGERLIPPSPEHSLGRVRMAHSALMIHGVLASLLLGALHAVSSRPAKRAAGLKSVAWAGFVLLQLSLLAGALAMVYGHGGAMPLFEMPVWADAGLVVGWVFALGALIGSMQVHEDVPESAYAAGVTPWLASALVGGVLVMGGAALLPWLPLPPHAAAAWMGAFQGGLVQAVLLPLAFAAMLPFLKFRMPHALWNRWWQGLLAVVLAGAAPLAGLGSRAAEGAPRGLLEAEFIATAVYGAVILLLMTSFALALRSAVRDTLEPPPWPSRSMLWFAAGWVAMAVYGAQELLLLVDAGYREAVRFTDWTAGRQHLLLLLGLGSWAFGCLDELWPELRRSERWRIPVLADLHLVLTLAGGWTMAATLFTAGWAQSRLAESMLPWNDVVEGAGPMWAIRMTAGLTILFAQLLLLVNLLATRDRSLPALRKPKAGPADPELLDPEAVGDMLR